MVLLFVLILAALVIVAGSLYIGVAFAKLVMGEARSVFDSAVNKVDSAPYPPYDPSNPIHNPSGFRHGTPEGFKNDNS